MPHDTSRMLDNHNIDSNIRFHFSMEYNRNARFLGPSYDVYTVLTPLVKMGFTPSRHNVRYIQHCFMDGVSFGPIPGDKTKDQLVSPPAPTTTSEYRGYIYEQAKDKFQDVHVLRDKQIPHLVFYRDLVAQRADKEHAFVGILYIYGIELMCKSVRKPFKVEKIFDTFIDNIR